MDVVTREDEDLLLDLLNTTPVVDGERTDELADPDMAQEWAAGHGGAGGAGEIAALRRVRAAIQDVVRGAADPQTLEAHLERIELRPRLHDGTLGWELQAPTDEALAARVLLAWAVLGEREPGRLRPCANPECCRFLHDRSNANTARWCSMALCGNRFKARRHYRRTRKPGA
ncbi:CGNR zinc finger domain-containing protein [Promicromonospora iranensis]|uniref:RNA-binding Zn ribbon-like protein n=1 Tax=Promicromonospora iranensis TaxID=1105144 RepID=A0ABU2CGR7_9MICO|nr:CGNR zinc finger domain-containing protein [Promicromonospora iranensis]MDR7380509.1 putative RNA-binding Zn ribbon-like protein [Promicromonospora iranensis]